MSNSSLVSYTKISPHKTSPRSGTISKITIHHMAGKLSVEGCASCFLGSRQASSNYGIDSDGRVGMYVEEKDRAWTSSSASNDNVAVTIEVADDTNSAPWHSSNAAMAKLILLCADICRRNNISQLVYTGNTSGNLTLHKWFASTDCPGAYLEGMMPTIAKEVNGLIQSGQTSYVFNGATADGSFINTSYSGSTGTTLSMDISNFTPFVVTVDPSVTKIDYDDLIDKHVCGMLFEAGYLYDTTHSEVPFRNKNIAKQVKDCNEAGLRFALYSRVRSRTIAEAKKECKQLYYTISKYPPGMGVWLTLEFPKNQKKSRNHAILDYYYEQLCEWGLEQGCGLYCSKDDLKKINWEDYQDKFLLWYQNMFEDESEYSQAQGLMYPEFFKLDPTTPTTIPTVVSPGSNSLNLTNAYSLNSGSVNPAVSNLTGKNTGEKMAMYACQFVGNPYVWGGESLTNGADCSGFTLAVHREFGISLPHSSSAQASCGRAVQNLQSLLPGDLVCYDGHVAMYIGNNQIVHASNKKDGIKISSPPNYRTIVALRRCW